MHIYIDADACPKAIKQIVFKAAQRSQTHTTLVANHPLPKPASPFIHMRQVQQGFDVADDTIVELVKPGDLVITADIPLAADVLAKHGQALNPRGEMYTQDTIKTRLNIRDFMDTMRASGVQTGGPSAISQKEIQLFANALDRWITHAKKRRP
jgi:uncharacterized protein YaiI (UPF0178 family)